jgi:excinuclease ABC subunit C
MKYYSKKQMYEDAAQIRNRMYAFEHINDIAVIKKERTLEQYKNIPERIEAYDISNIGSNFAVGSMVVLTGGEIDKNEYRKFRIIHKYTDHKNYTNENNSKLHKYKDRIDCAKQNEHQNDPAMIGQILDRRLNHKEWSYPDLILIDGGKSQLSAALKAIKNHKLKIPVIAVAKGPSRKGFKLFRNSIAQKLIIEKKFIEYVRDEAHRFAITYHRKLRASTFIKKL